MRKVKVAIIGGGWFGQFHLDNLLTMADVEVTAFATGNKERLAALSAKSPKSRTYASQEELVAAESELDALVVCVPPDSHGDIELLAARNKINLYMEKPLGVDIDKVNSWEKAIRESGIIAAVGYQTRYNPHLEAIKMKIADDNEEIGTVVVKWMGIMPETPWWRVNARSGGQFAEQVTHLIDALRYLFGDVATVYSTSRKGLNRNIPHYDIEDASTTVFTFESGLLATITCGCFNDPKMAKDEICIEIYGKRRRFFFEWNGTAGWENKLEAQSSHFDTLYHYPALRTFIEAIKSGDPSHLRSPYSDAVKTFRTTWAANVSMQSHAEVNVSSWSGR